MLDRQRVRDLFAEALVLPPEEVRAWLARACGGDAELETEVLSLLDSAARRPQFLGAPTAAHAGAAAAQPGEALGTVLGHYRLVQVLGEGGFGIVYVAEQLEPVRRQVALKLIKLGMDTRAVIARFEAERQALAMMDHANIARVFDAGATGSGRPYFVMELVRGEPITAYCDRNNLTIAYRLELFVQVCHAVQHAHSKGVIHRDIKPTNVLVTTEDGRPLVKVIDFGIAKATQRSATDKTAFTEHRQLVGTPEYMSPEQAEGSPNIDTRTDVYGLGVLLYELLTGATPFDGKSLRSAAYAEIQRIIREVEPPKPSTRVGTLGDTITSVASHRRTAPGRLSPMLRGDLDWIVMRCLEKDRARRYATSDALAADLHAYLRGDPVSAVPPSAGYRLRKFVGRHRGLVSATAIVVLALVLGLIGTAVGLRAATRARGEAQASAERASREAEQARAINDFMREVLTSVEPQKSGADVRLIQVLENASASASQRFSELPLLEAEIQQTLHVVYTRLSLLQPALDSARRAAELFAAHAERGAADPRTLRAQCQVMTAAMNLGRLWEAEKILAAVMPLAETSLGNDHAITLTTRLIQADVHMKHRRFEEADALLTPLKTHPTFSNDQLAQCQIASLLYRSQKLRTPLVQRGGGGGPGWGGWGGPARSTYWTAIKALAAEWSLRARIAHGPRSAEYVKSEAALAEAQAQLGECHEAIGRCRAILSQTASNLGECHSARGDVMRALALALARVNENQEAADLRLRGLACARSDSSNPIFTLAVIGDTLAYLRRAGRADEGEKLATEGLTIMKSFGAAHDDGVFQFEIHLADFVSMNGAAERATGLFSSLLSRETEIESNATRSRLLIYYASHLCRLGQFDLAEQSLNRAVEIRGDVFTGTLLDLPDDLIGGFIELYTASHNAEKLLEYQQLRARAFGFSPPAADK